MQMLFFLWACTAEKSSPLSDEMVTETRVYEYDDVLRITHGTVLGSHNSYHLQPESQTVPEWNYSHPPLSQQLDQGLRQFELDVLRDPDTGELRVLHVPVLDAETSCYLLSDCLEELAAWSESHPWHFPLQILIEPKTEFAQWAFFTDQAVWEEITQLVQDRLGDTLFTPSELQGSHASLRDAVLTDGWPTLEVMRGRMILVLLDTGEAREHYLAGSTQIMFPLVDEEHELAAYFLKDDPYDIRIGPAVEQGFLVRTRGDASLIVDPSRLEQALSSGAHAISSDLLDSHDWVDPEHPISCNAVVFQEECAKDHLE